MGRDSGASGLSAREITVGYGKDAPILEGLSLDVLEGGVDRHCRPKRVR